MYEIETECEVYKSKCVSLFLNRVRQGVGKTESALRLKERNSVWSLKSKCVSLYELSVLGCGKDKGSALRCTIERNRVWSLKSKCVSLFELSVFGRRKN